MASAPIDTHVTFALFVVCAAPTPSDHDDERILAQIMEKIKNIPLAADLFRAIC